MSEDLPTFDLPANANSGNAGGGQPLMPGLLEIYLAVLIVITF